MGAACGRHHSLVLAENGDVYSFGLGRHGSLGLGHRENAALPTLVSAPKEAGKRVVQVAAGADFSLLLTSDGGVWSFGCSDYGQVAQGQGSASTERYIATPRPVAALAGKQIVHIAAGEHHAGAVTASGEAFTWVGSPMCFELVRSQALSVTGAGLGRPTRLGVAARAQPNPSPR